MQILYIGNFLSKHGLNPTYSETLVEKLAATDLRIRIASNRLNKIIRMLDMVTRLLFNHRSIDCAVIDLYSGKHALIYAQVMSRLCSWLHVPYVIVLHGGGLPSIMKETPQKVLGIIQNAKFTVAPSAYIADFFSHYQDTVLIPNAIDIPAYHYQQKSVLSPRLLFLRSFHRLTSPQDAILCLDEVKQQFPDAALTMAGADEDGTLAECKALVSKLGLETSVKFPGRLSKPEIYQLSLDHDIFLHTMLVDNFPITLLEAMALGLCIVATRVGGVPFLLKSGQNALLVEPGDHQAMAQAVLYYLTYQSQARAMRQQAHQDVVDFNWDNVLPLWRKLFGLPPQTT